MIHAVAMAFWLTTGGSRAWADEPAPPTADAPSAAAAPVKVPPVLLAQVAPAYPPEAGGEEGHVDVVVTVSPEGTVREATFHAGGPEVFVPSALAAARELRFTPGTRDGVAVGWRLVVHFEFSPPAPAAAPAPEPERPDGAAEEVYVYGERDLADGETHAVATLSAQDLERTAGSDLAETIASVPGVTVGRGSADSAKPIIRGQVERRLLLLFDGVRHESQKWGLDHATEIDPFAAGAIHVVKGAAGVRYGPDAIGGVVLVDPPPLPEEAGVGGRVQLVGAANGWRGVAAARVDGATAGGFGWRVEGNYGRGAAVSTPTYVLGNTGGQAWNVGATLALRRKTFSLEASYHHFDLTEGVCYCVRSGSPEDFLSQLDAEAPLNADAWTTTTTIDRPYQAVAHDIALARGRLESELGDALTVTYAFQSNRRREYEQARASITGPQYDFTLRTHTLDASVSPRVVGLPGGADLVGEAGVSGTFQENVYACLPLIPNFRAFQGGAFLAERVRTPRVEVELGGRFDHLSRAAYLTPSAYERALARGTLGPDDCEVGPDAARCPARYDGGSVSLGGLWRAVPGSLEVRLDLSSATRFPNADELYLNGSAPTFPVYALGDPSLGAETTWGASPTVGLRLPWIEAEASAYTNLIDDYIYFAPELVGGVPVVDVTVEGAFPRFSFRPIDALFYGADGGAILFPGQPVSVSVQGALVRALDRSTRSPLVMIPADRVRGALRGSMPDVGPVRSGFVELSGQYVFEQTHVDPAADLAPPPPAYFLVGATLGAELNLRSRTVRVSLEGENLLNARYRDYSSLLRYYADEPGRDVRLRIGVDL